MDLEDNIDGLIINMNGMWEFEGRILDSILDLR